MMIPYYLRVKRVYLEQEKAAEVQHLLSKDEELKNLTSSLIPQSQSEEQSNLQAPALGDC